MFSLSELLFLCVLVLILIGPRQLPELARTVGRWLNELRNTRDSLMAEFKKAHKKETESKEDAEGSRDSHS